MAEAISPELPLESPAVGRWLVAIAVMASAMMELIDTSAVNVSLPYIAGNLSATVNEATWVLTSYLVSNAIVLPLAGWLANYFGRKRLLMIAVAGFTISSMLCGLAPSLPLLIVFRVRSSRRLAQFCWKLSPAKSAGTRWRSGASGSSSRRSWRRCWAAG
jgi:MFS family permease